MAKLLDITINTDFYGLMVTATLTVRWNSHSDYEIERVCIDSITNRADTLETVRVGMDVRDVSDFYSENADRIDQYIAAEIAGEAEYQQELVEELAWEAAVERNEHAENMR